MKKRLPFYDRCKVAVLVAMIVGCVAIGGQAEQESVMVMLPINQKVIVLDAGHGGWDPGKTGSGGQDEKHINLAIMEKLQRYLEMGGATVYITRSTDEALGESKREDMAGRKEIADDGQGDLLISIHQNAFPSSSVKGAQVFYHEKSVAGKALAEIVQESLRENVAPDNTRQAKANSDYYILKAIEVPTILVECGFLSNGQEEKQLNEDAYQAQIAWAIYQGVMTYYEGVAQEAVWEPIL